MRLKLLLPLFLILALASCSNQTVFDEYSAIENHSMHQDSAYKFHFDISDTTHYYNIAFKLRIDDSYRYSNMYVLYKMTGPSGKSKTVRQNFELANKSGKWLGKGYSNLFSYTFPIMHEVEFKSSGEYTLELAQYMRTENLGGVHDVGFEITKGEEVF